LKFRKIDDLPVHVIFGSVFQALSGPARVRFSVMPGCLKTARHEFFARRNYFRLK